MKMPRYVLCLLALTLCAAEPAKPAKPTGFQVFRLWLPQIPSANNTAHDVAGLEKAPNLASGTFQVTGATFEQMWNYYAKRCGVDQAYEEKTFLNTGKAGPNGTWIVSERPSEEGQGGRGVRCSS